ncbi:MAG: type I-E CRISPR-associated protein Cse1/CasA [Myxococcales bacterium]|nr:type I-E CRISPR-associated protein Cse1/CasA [Myxococcales bacterium]
MNLLDLAWIPVRGAPRRWLTLAEVTRVPADAIAAPRADLTCGLLECLVGLAQLALQPDDDLLIDLDDAPPPADAFAAGLAPWRSAFQLRGEGPLFLQEHDLPDDADVVPIEKLFLDSSGDYFNKPGTTQALCPACAAAALYVHQSRANQGGRGYRTSLRGGAPLSTLVVPAPRAPAPGGTLWRTIFHNLLRAEVLGQLASGPLRAEAIFPWLLPERPDQLTTLDVHPLHLWWGMPRRVRLCWTDAPGTCDLCGEAADATAHAFQRVSLGINYTGAFCHPQNPILEDKLGPRCLATSADGVRYKDWLGLVAGSQGKDQQITHAAVIRAAHEQGYTLQIRAFGYAMSSAKPLAWHDRTLPLLDAGPADAGVLAAWIGLAIEAAGYVRSQLLGQIVAAWTTGKLRGDTAPISNAFWEETEADFFAGVAAVRTGAGTPEARETASEAWRLALIRHATALFDRYVQPDVSLGRPLARVMTAFNRLRATLNGPKLRQALALPLPVKPTPGKRKKG